MGDAGPQTPLPETHIAAPQPSPNPSHAQPRQVHVLVTGFGPFKIFTTNPSYLIASALPPTLYPAAPPPPLPRDGPHPPSDPLPARNALSSFFNRHISSHPQAQPHVQLLSQPLRPPNETPYIIHLHTCPDPVHVAYTPTAILIPSLLNPSTNASVFPGYPAGIDFDYVLHIGLASGRDSYTLETLAHRDSYIIPDNDQAIGRPVSDAWRHNGVPSSLNVGWDGPDVLRRWTTEVERRETEGYPISAHISVPIPAAAPPTIEPANDTNSKSWMVQHGILAHPAQPSPSTTSLSPIGGGSVLRASLVAPKRAVVKLSRDAGRFLCEFILICSLIHRWKQEQNAPCQPSKLGKVAFLHVPNGIEADDIAKGVMVAESAIRAVVASWEAGWRNGAVYEREAEVECEVGKEGGKVAVEQEGFEERGTGDEILR